MVKSAVLQNPGYLGYWKPGNFILRHASALLLVDCRACGVSTVLARYEGGLHTIRCCRCHYPIFGTSQHAIAFEVLLRFGWTNMEALQAALDDPTAV